MLKVVFAGVEGDARQSLTLGHLWELGRLVGRWVLRVVGSVITFCLTSDTFLAVKGSGLIR